MFLDVIDDVFYGRDLLDVFIGDLDAELLFHRHREFDDLERIGALDAYKLVKAHGYNASLNLLWALQAALLDIHWTQLPAGVKRALRQRLEKS